MRDFQDGVVRLKRPADKRGESAASVLLFAQTAQMLDPVLDSFHMAEHHRRARFQSELMRDLHYFQPRIRIAFQRRDPIANAVYQNFSAAAGNGTEPGFLEPRNQIAQRHSE